MMDNRIFNVNGRGIDMLRATLALAFIQEGDEDKPATAAGWIVIPNKGLVLLWGMLDNEAEAFKKFNWGRFPVPMSACEVTLMVYNWLSSQNSKMKCSGWDADADHDGENVYGWRVYVEDWGRIEGSPGGAYSICAIRPSFNWLGK